MGPVSKMKEYSMSETKKQTANTAFDGPTMAFRRCGGNIATVTQAGIPEWHPDVREEDVAEVRALMLKQPDSLPSGTILTFIKK